MGSQHTGVIQTLYESREKKGIKLQFNPETAAEIESYITGLNDMAEAYKKVPEIVQGLNELKSKANALLISHASEDEIISGIRKLTTVQGPDGQKINVSSFGKGKSQKVKDADEFKERTLKRIDQTIQNTVALMQWKSDPTLGAFLQQARAIDRGLSGHEMDKLVKELIRSDSFQAYQSSKEAYIKEWLKPFQAELGRPIESLTEEELQEAMKRMKVVMKQRMTEGNLIVHPNPDQFKDFNMKNHDMINGYDKTFWNNDLLIDEFIAFTQGVLSRFTFLLDKQFLVFQFRQEPYLYLIGFSHEAFVNAEQLEDGNLLIAPHIKAIIPGKENTYRELNKTGFTSVGLYMDMLRETLKPFFSALAEKINFPLSKEFKQHFRIS
ncbi:MAG: hypothetical protein HQM11_10190 [SAR324 cluster bacterium]|nr:hypothetical protein [SAR324 cluster bacterium]